jgi:acetyl esterase
MATETLDPNVCRLIETLRAEARPPIETMPLAEARRAAAELIRRFAGEPEEVAWVDDLTIPGPAGEIPVRIYRPGTSEPAPCMIYFHGGGWVVCSIDTHDGPCRAIARRAGAVVVSVGYRLAPEHKFPAAVDDCYAAACWVADNAERLGIDPKRISVGGDSAGGTLSTVVCLKARDEGGPRIALQALVYPVADLSSFETPSHRSFSEGALRRSEMEWFRDNYLARPEDARNAHASPLLAADLRGLPPALIITAECDPLRDEGAAYARRLQSAGVPVTHQCYSGMIHLFFSLPGAIPQGLDAVEQVARAVRAARL